MITNPQPPQRTPQEVLDKLVVDCWQVQNASNLLGVSLSFHKALCELRTLPPEIRIHEVNSHPVTIMWMDKLMSLTGTQSYAPIEGQRISEAYEWVRKYAEERGLKLS